MASVKKKTVAVTWMDGRQETYGTRGPVDVTATEVVITSEAYERDLPGSSCKRVPLANVRFYDITVE